MISQGIGLQPGAALECSAKTDLNSLDKSCSATKVSNAVGGIVIRGSKSLVGVELAGSMGTTTGAPSVKLVAVSTEPSSASLYTICLSRLNGSNSSSGEVV